MGILLSIHILITLFLILTVLIQKNEGGSSLFANSASGGLFNARGTSNVLTKATWILAAIFLINCILMATLDTSKIKSTQTIIEQVEQNGAAAEDATSEDGDEEYTDSEDAEGEE